MVEYIKDSLDIELEERYYSAVTPGYPNDLCD
jgi:hypothetical protein